MKFNNDKTSVILSFEEVKQLYWSFDLFEGLDESLEELEEEQPMFKFFKNYEAEIIYSPDNSANIGEQGVEGNEWQSFLEELENLKKENMMNLTKDNISEKATKSWKNYGDTNAREHGGRFLKFEEGEYATSDHWTLVITTDMEGHGMLENSDDRYMFQEWFIEPDMVWVDGEPSKGFTDIMQDEENEVREDINPQDVEKVERLLPFLVSHIQAEGYDTYAANYWKHLQENWGISASQFT